MKLKYQKIIVIILIITIFTGCQKEKSDVTIDDTNTNRDTVINSIVGNYYINIIDNDNNEYLYFSKNLSLSFKNDFTCTYLNTDISYLLTKNPNLTKCTWSLDDNNKMKLYLVSANNNTRFEFDIDVNDDLILESTLYDEDYKSLFYQNNIKGIKFVKDKVNSDDKLYFSLNFDQDTYELKNIEEISTDYMHRIVIKKNSVKSIDELLIVKREGYSYEIEGNIDFNTAGLYPIKILFKDKNNNVVYKVIKIISIIPSETEQNNWYKNYFSEYIIPNRYTTTDNTYYNLKTNEKKNLCIQLTDTDNYSILLLKNGYKCEDFYKMIDYKVDYQKEYPVGGSYITYGEVTTKTPTLGELDKFIKNEKNRINNIKN